MDLPPSSPELQQNRHLFRYPGQSQRFPRFIYTIPTSPHRTQSPAFAAEKSWCAVCLYARSPVSPLPSLNLQTLTASSALAAGIVALIYRARLYRRHDTFWNNSFVYVIT